MTKQELVNYLELLLQKTFPNINHIEVALSGGIDSICLLHLLSHLSTKCGFLLSATHINHQISKHSNYWEDFCHQICDSLNIPITSTKVIVNLNGGNGLEAEARKVRYEVFKQSKANVLALAHHSDDQSETVLLQLLRGGSPKGLAAMPKVRKLNNKNNTQLWRPLLNITRTQLEKIALEEGWVWIDDDSNTNTQFKRNFLRHNVMPILLKEYPDYKNQFMRASQHAADAADILSEVADTDLKILLIDDRTINLDILTTLSPARQRNAIVTWLCKFNISTNPKKIDDILTQLLSSVNSSIPKFILKDWILTRYQQHAILLRKYTTPNEEINIKFSLENLIIDIPEWCGKLHFKPTNNGINYSTICDNLSVRRRMGGEIVYHNGINKTLKNVLQEAKIPPYRRERTPLLYSNNTILAMPGLFINTKLLSTRSEAGYIPIWIPYDGY